MEQWARVRHKVLVEKRSKRSVMAGEGLHWETLQKMLSHSAPPGYRRERERRRKFDAHVEWVCGVLLRDREVPRKQPHSAKRIFDRLVEERGFAGGSTAVKDLVAELKAGSGEVFVPLIHRPGEAQVDFGHALITVDGVLRKCPFFVMSLRYNPIFPPSGPAQGLAQGPPVRSKFPAAGSIGRPRHLSRWRVPTRPRLAPSRTITSPPASAWAWRRPAGRRWRTGVPRAGVGAPRD